jgi:hypothetical protein
VSKPKLNNAAPTPYSMQEPLFTNQHSTNDTTVALEGYIILNTFVPTKRKLPSSVVPCASYCWLLYLAYTHSRSQAFVTLLMRYFSHALTPLMEPFEHFQNRLRILTSSSRSPYPTMFGAFVFLSGETRHMRLPDLVP